MASRGEVKRQLRCPNQGPKGEGCQEASAAPQGPATSTRADQPKVTGVAARQPVCKLLFRHLGSFTGGLQAGLAAHLEKHSKSSGSALRPAVLGASDGLLSNFNLVMGVAGASLPSRSILLTGLAGLLAGGISMGMGEWISVQSSRELYQKQILGEKNEIAAAPTQETAELALIYQARGFGEATSGTLASRMMQNPDTALDAMTRDELNIDPAKLGGSAWEAAVLSLLMFMAGAFIPVVPYFFLSGATAVIVSAGVSAAGLFAVGGTITIFTG